MSKINFKGSRWYKCDLHVHSKTSNCFKDEDSSPEEWIDKAIQENLDCIAVTDHNSSFGIDTLKNAAKDKEITIFPGVEITCDTSKIHLLILFETDKNSDYVRDFLVKTGIRSDDFGKDETNTDLNIFDVIDIATEYEALVIPAHIDDYNGINSISHQNLLKLFSLSKVNGVQVVHQDFIQSNLTIKNNTSLIENINDYYGNPTSPIGETLIKNWYNTVQLAIKNKCAILTFSDNPQMLKSPKHGLWGIGNRYTYIKMGEVPNLEGLRQALLLPDFRTKNCFQTQIKPKIMPDLWIKSINVSNTTITNNTVPLIIEFNPQLNTIIGGRGSGKSSILRFLRGVFNKTLDIKNLEEILNDHIDFYKRVDNDNTGVLTDDSEIIIEFVRKNTLYKIKSSNIYDSENQDIYIEMQNEDLTWIEVTDDSFIDFFEFDHFSQKQIYEIAQKPNALKERIDSAIPEIENLKTEKNELIQSYFETSASLRVIDELIANKGKHETIINDINFNIEKMKKSGISEILEKQEKFSREKELLFGFKNSITIKIDELKTFAQAFKLDSIDIASFSEDHKSDIEKANSLIFEKIDHVRKEIEKSKLELDADFDMYKQIMNTSKWLTDFKENEKLLKDKEAKLAEEGIEDINIFKELLESKKQYERELESITSKIKNKEELEIKQDSLVKRIFEIRTEIFKLRDNFVKKILKNGKVKIKVNKFRNKHDFEYQFRSIIQRNNSSFQSDIDSIIEYCFSGNIEDSMRTFKIEIMKILKNTENNLELSARFNSLLKGLNTQQIDEIMLLLPEDDIEVQYRLSDSSPFKPLSTASAGQKTTSILTFILSFGNIPLILDQPEDDLDNKLVYELVVDRLLHTKEQRQIIIVTHNANVPVNGDAEYVISMDSSSNFVNTLNSGSVDQHNIKNEICEVMEGGLKAFEMRSRRYTNK